MSHEKHENGPDIRQLRQQSLPEATFPGGRNQSFRVYLEPRIHGEIHKHSRDNSAVEICGVLVGKWARDADGPYVLISESIRGEAATSKFAEVTFTHETWAKINQQMDTQFAHLAIVGWYHSHPDFGVFLSDRDRFIQEHFFSGPGQLAYVVDPVRQTEGVFVWRQGKPVLTAHYWVGDRVQIATAAGDEAPAPKPPGQPVIAGAGSNSQGGGSSWVNLLLQAALYLTVFLIGVLVAERLSAFDRLRIEQSAFARAWVYLKLRPTLGDDVDLVGQDMQAAIRDLEPLLKEHLKLSEDGKDAEERWKKILIRLGKSLQRLQDIKKIYGLTPDERRLLETLGEQARSAAENKTKSESPPAAKAADKQDARPGDK